MSEEKETILDQFERYFTRDIAEEAAKSIGTGAFINFHIHGKTLKTDPTHIFCLTRSGRQNHMLTPSAPECELEFRMTESAARELLADKSDTIAEIGVNILKLIFSKDETKVVQIQIKT
ncbi:MAG: hypothetical protein AAB425_12370, partial [Bdellovibrionota bacterium]